MPSGRDLLHTPPASWAGWPAGLLLNPRLDADLRTRVLGADFPDLPDHVWLATSGTGGFLKLVALSRAALEASAASVNAFLAATAADTWINPLPPFHAGGLGIVIRAALSGAAWFPAGPWDPAAFTRLAAARRATLCSLVPTQVFDLVAARLPAPLSLRAVIVGGGALDEDLRRRAAALGWLLLPSYGLTETASQVATAAPGGTDFTLLPLLPHVEARTDAAGLLLLRGPSLLTGWLLLAPDRPPRWEDPKSPDGWLPTADRAEIYDRSLRVLGRLDDLVKIRGELVDIAALERRLQSRLGTPHVSLAVHSDGRTGCSLRIIAADETVAAAARTALDIFPPFARPDHVSIGDIPRTALGKIIRRPADGPPPA